MSKSRTVFVFCILLLYLLPTCIQPVYDDKGFITQITIGLPFMQSGDEPHYYITLYSLVNDHDIFLTNNYNNALHQEGIDAGKKKLGPYERHTRIYDPIKKTVTSFSFENSTEGVRPDLSFLKAEKEYKEISGHPIGLPLFAFFFLWPLQQTALLEPITIFLTLIMTLLGIYFFYKIMCVYHNEKIAILATVLFALATPFWHYAKTFWAEPYLAVFIIMSWYIIMKPNTTLLTTKKQVLQMGIAGALLGMGVMMKYPFALVVFPFWAYLLWKKAWKEWIALSLPLGVIALTILSLNMYLTGSPLQFNQAEAVSLSLSLKGIIRWFFDPTFGFFTFAPILLFSFGGVTLFYREHKEQAVVMFSLIIPYFLFWASYSVVQDGGGGYAARYLVPLLPLFTILCSFFLKSLQNREVEQKKKMKIVILKSLFMVLFIISLGINILAAFIYPAFIGYSLPTALTKIFLKIRLFLLL